MITLILGELYGMNSYEELVDAIQNLRQSGLRDDDIQQILNKSIKKDGGCVLKLSRKKNKKGQTYTAYEVIE